MTTVEAIYENGMFRPVSNVPKTLKEHERVRITIEEGIGENFLEFDKSSGNNGITNRSATRIVDETFGSTSLIKKKDLISLAEDEEFSGY